MSYHHLLFGLLFLCGCATSRAPVPSGVVPDQKAVSDADIEYGTQVFDAIRSRYPVSSDPAMNEKVRRVTDKLTAKGEAAKFPWFIYVLEGDNVKNAAATRGNYIFVWTGMVRAAETDGELATIISHEIAHVLAKHPEPTADEEIADIFGSILSDATERVMVHQGGAVGAAASLAAMLVQLGYNAFLVNPESQRKELEADRIGLMILAKTGFDPNEAVNFWERAQNDPAFGSSAVEFLSSHPSSTERLKALREVLPVALATYRGETPPPAILSASAKLRSSLPPKSALAATGGPSLREVWIVTEGNIEVYSEPSPESQVIGKLKKDTAVIVESLEKRWLKISSPVAGYVRSKELAPEG